jgi:2-polyprenyl-3-methyl-5-hydroxy-6-metoxy-1,4-benzoquinol methylase
MSAFESDWREVMKRLSGPEFLNVVDDLVAFTGLTKKQVCTRIMKRHGKHKARGWFHEEWAWHDPKDDGEIGWFYRSAQSYIFSNSRRPRWHMLKNLARLLPEGRVLDYGGGIGNDVLFLARRGYEAHYLELSVVQQEFVRFRSGRHRLKVKIIEPHHEGRLDPVECVDAEYNAVLLQHVLEHIPNYHIPLGHLIGRLRPGGYIIEHSPFNVRDPKSKNGWRRNKLTHLEASIPLTEAMVGMRLVHRHKRGPQIWRKT